VIPIKAGACGAVVQTMATGVVLLPDAASLTAGVAAELIQVNPREARHFDPAPVAACVRSQRVPLKQQDVSG